MLGRHDLSLRDRTVAAWLWSERRGVIAGAAASALHGAQWVDATAPIELIAGGARRHPGLLVRNETLAPDEVTKVAGIPVTTLTRTAFDLARHLPRDEAVARLDALQVRDALLPEGRDAMRAAVSGGARGQIPADGAAPGRRRSGVPAGDLASAVAHRRRVAAAHHADPRRRWTWPAGARARHGLGRLHGRRRVRRRPAPHRSPAVRQGRADQTRKLERLGWHVVRT